LIEGFVLQYIAAQSVALRTLKLQKGQTMDIVEITAVALATMTIVLTFLYWREVSQRNKELLGLSKMSNDMVYIGMSRISNNIINIGKRLDKLEHQILCQQNETDNKTTISELSSHE
jgi:hypothetical protein